MQLIEMRAMEDAMDASDICRQPRVTHEIVALVTCRVDQQQTTDEPTYNHRWATDDFTQKISKYISTGV